MLHILQIHDGLVQLAYPCEYVSLLIGGGGASEEGRVIAFVNLLH